MTALTDMHEAQSLVRALVAGTQYGRGWTMADLNIANKGADDLVDEVIVEKVARALCAKEWLPESGWTFEMEVSDPSVKLYWMDSARAAIEAYTSALAAASPTHTGEK